MQNKWNCTIIALAMAMMLGAVDIHAVCVPCQDVVDDTLDRACQEFAASPPTSEAGMANTALDIFNEILSAAELCDAGQSVGGSAAACQDDLFRRLGVSLPVPEPEQEWADTGHMTIDGRLVTGGHDQLYALEVDYLDIDANSNYVYALMTLVSHLQNGEISTGQMRWLYERAIMSAVPIDIIAEYMSFEHRTANLEDHVVGSGGDSIARVLLYDVTQMIINGHLYDENPKSRSTYDALVDQAAQQLGVPGEVSAQIRDIVDEELALLGNKKEIFWAEMPYAPPIAIDTTPDEEWTTGGGHMTVDGRLVVGGHTQLYALDVDYLAIDANSNYVYALMAMVSHLQDGEIPSGQMGWLKERAYMSAVPRDIIEEYIAFEHRTANLEDHMIGSGGDSIARVLLYDVMQMITHGDLYDDNPRQSTYNEFFGEAAGRVDVPASVVAQIREVVNSEVELLDKKRVVFWSETPYVPPDNSTVPPDNTTIDDPNNTTIDDPNNIINDPINIIIDDPNNTIINDPINIIINDPINIIDDPNNTTIDDPNNIINDPINIILDDPINIIINDPIYIINDPIIIIDDPNDY
jgi:hypothetical protein